MSYAGSFLKAHGQNCIILRTIPVNTRVSIKRSTNASRDLGTREAYWQGLILSDASLQSGEIVEIDGAKYLAQTVDYDPASSEDAFFVVKCNAILTHKRLTETADEDWNPVQSWPTVNATVYAYEFIQTYRLMQTDVGLLDSTKYVFQVPKSLGIQVLDRIVYNGKNYKPVSIDDSLKGISIIQAAFDERP